MLSRRTEDERKETEEDKDTTAQWRRKGGMANTTKYNVLSTDAGAQDKDEPKTALVHPKGDSLRFRQPNGHAERKQSTKHTRGENLEQCQAKNNP